MFEQFVRDASAFSVSFYETILKGLTLDFALKIAVLYALIIWLACIIWVIKDITNRTTNILFQVLAILLVIVFTPIFGLPVYMLIRPRTTLFERYYEETSLEELEETAEIGEVETGLACPSCHESIEPNHKFCPHCRFELMADCRACHAPVHVSWRYCAACGHDQSEAAPSSATPKPSKKKSVPAHEKSKKGSDTLSNSDADEGKKEA